MATTGAGEAFILMQLPQLDALRTPAAPLPAGVKLAWSEGLARSRADFVRLHHEVGDDHGADPALFDATFGSDPAVLSRRMAFLLREPRAQPEPEPEPEADTDRPRPGWMEAVGTCTAWSVGSTGWVHSLAVSPAHQGRGLADHLLRATLERLASLGHSDAMLAVRPSAHRALLLYQRWGFVPVLEDDLDRAQWAAAAAAAAAGRRVAALSLAPHGAEYRARVAALLARPGRLGEHNSSWAICGMAAVVYAALLRRPERVVVHTTVCKRLDSLGCLFTQLALRCCSGYCGGCSG